MSKCRLCGRGALEASELGHHLERVNKKGQKGIWQCYPCCDEKTGGQSEAILNSLEAPENDH